MGSVESDSLVFEVQGVEFTSEYRAFVCAREGVRINFQL